MPFIGYRHKPITGNKLPFAMTWESVPQKIEIMVMCARSFLEGAMSTRFRLYLECKIHFDPRYRVYLGKDGEQIVILLGGGTKDRHRPYAS
jgi:hypothetical protein